MLWALLDDFHAWGAAYTLTTLDSRLASEGITLPANEVVTVQAGEYEATFSASLARAEAALIIAPETDNILARLSAAVEAAGIPLLGSSSAAIAIAGNKAECYQRFQSAELPTPATLTTSFSEASQAADRLGYPLVTKPLDGVGCEGVCLVETPDELKAALQETRLATRQDQILLQSYLSGEHASVSLLAASGSIALSLNEQHIQAGCPFVYHGGTVPVEHPARQRAFDLARQAVALIPGLRGYVGVDMILAGEDAWLVEINPRLTTSYFGLRQVLKMNLAQAIWDACQEGVLPGRVNLCGQVSFDKNDLIKSIQVRTTRGET